MGMYLDITGQDQIIEVSVMFKENLVIFLIFFAILMSCFAVSAEANSGSGSLELTCRSQAKDVAVTTYNNCMTDGRNKHIETIRNEYQQKLKDLKSYYDNELKRIDGGTAVPAPQSKNEPTIQLQPTQVQSAKPKKTSALRSQSSRRQKPQVLPQKTARSRPQKTYSARPQEVVVVEPTNPYQQEEKSMDETSTYSASPYQESDEDRVDVVDIQSQE
jgi:hypothetical protein